MDIAIEIAKTIVIGLVGFFIWRHQHNLERNFKMAENLNKYKIEVYNEIMEPFVILCMSEEAWLLDPRSNKVKTRTKEQTTASIIMSVKYRRLLFQLCMFCSDRAVHIYNGITDSNREEGSNEPVKLFADLILEIRKSVGNEETALTREDVLTLFVSDRENINAILQD